MRIQRVSIQNFRNVPNVEQDLNGCNILLLADNTLGKSNFIKAIQGALAGTVGKNSITKGKKNAEVSVTMADFNKKGEAIAGTDYVFKLKIDKVKDTEEEKVILELHAPNGMKERSKTIIGGIVGEIELDYNFVELSKTAAGKVKQVQIIKSYLDEEIIEALRVFENKSKTAYDERTEVNRVVKNLEGFLSKNELNPDDFKIYADPKKFDVLQKQIDAANKVNNTRIQVAERIKNRADEDIKNNERLAKVKKQIEELQAEQKTIEEGLVSNTTLTDSANQWLIDNPIKDVKKLNTELSEIGKHNEKNAQVKDFLAKKKEKQEKEAESGELTALIESNKAAISDTLRQMDFPIKGITFDEENVYFNGKLVDETAMSTAEIMMLEAELKMAKCPKAEVLFIQRGESLGLPLLKELQASAKKRGLQIVMEQVERGTEELKIEFMPKF